MGFEPDDTTHLPAKPYIPPIIQNHFQHNLEKEKDHESDFDSRSVESISSPTPYASLYTSDAIRKHQKKPSLVIETKDLERQRLIQTGRGSDGPTKTNWFGILLAFLSGVFFTLSSGIIKYLTDVDPMELLIWRAFIQCLLSVPIALYRRENLLGPKGGKGLQFIQGMVGGTTLVLLYYAFRLLPLGDAATIIFSSPVIVMAMSFFMLGEHCSVYRSFIVFLLIGGVVLITKPPFLFDIDNPEDIGNYNIWGYVAAILATLFTAFNIVVMRKCKHVHYSVVVFQLSFYSLLLSIGLLVFSGDMGIPKGGMKVWILIFLFAAFGVLGQVLVAVALVHEDAGRVAVTRSLDIVLAYILQVTVFGDIPDWTSFVGAGIVILCVVLIGVERLFHRVTKSIGL